MYTYAYIVKELCYIDMHMYLSYIYNVYNIYIYIYIYVIYVIYICYRGIYIT